MVGVIHGMGFGVLFLLAFAGGLAGLHSLRCGLVTEAGVVERIRRLKVGGRDGGRRVANRHHRYLDRVSVVPEKLPTSPRARLLADPDTADWHTFGMEWKEHVAWLAPMLATAVAFIVFYNGRDLIRHDRARRTAMLVFVLAFAFDAVALGAFITKVAPVQ